jgi:hypothetical protein
LPDAEKVAVKRVPPLHSYFASVATAAVLVTANRMNVGSGILLAAMSVLVLRICMQIIGRSLGRLASFVLASFMQVVGKPDEPEACDDRIGRF